jgi:hypothetical protein
MSAAKGAIPHVTGIALGKRKDKGSAYLSLAKSVAKKAARNVVRDMTK